ncbi:DNA polymerase III alpha subunit [hydrothermal vent metagenome]|uniref:DNA polymerase III subunit alpha n=1 Tax=hydrothermal vent metagenome TaxID=652676 RepID=A0A3B0R916_9ZZZZ
MQHSKFVHLHLHTQYSLLDGAIRPKELLALAHDYKMPAVAMTDHGNIFGAVEFYENAMKSGVKPIIGCEVYVAPGSMTDKTPPARRGEGRAHHLVLLVKNIKGYTNLCKLLSGAYIDGFYYKPRVDKEFLKAHNEGLIALSACLQGEVSRLLFTGQEESAERVALEFAEIFDNRRFFLELQDNGMPEQDKVNTAMIELAKKTGLPLVATNDCHYLRKADARFQDILLCIQTAKTVNDTNRMKFNTDQLYFKSPDEMIEAFKHVPEAIENTIEIAERCNLELTLGVDHLPDFPLPEGETVDSLLDELARDGLKTRLAAIGIEMTEEGGNRPVKEKKPTNAKNKPDENDHSEWAYLDRLQKELKVIKRMGFSGYFLIVSDFIDYARSRDIPVGPGRGSAAGSLVAYTLGITNIDPIRYNLLFERFLNPDRISLPDIDIDFCYEGRDEVIRYVGEKYGAENVTQIITFGQMKAKAVIRDVGRALDMPYSDVDRIAKLVPNTLNITLKDAIKEEPKLEELRKNDVRVAELLEAALALEGLPRHASTHAAGVVISNKPLVEYLPLYMGQKDNIVTTQFPMRDVERIGLVKFDFLGIKTLTLIDKAVKTIKINRGVEVDINNIDLSDGETYKLIGTGFTNGVFQLESSGMKELLIKLKPQTFEDMMAAVALYRPGPLQSGMVDDYIKRKHGKTSIVYDRPELESILENTYGVMVYQEQVMEISRTLAGFTPGEADMLRKAMGKKDPTVMVDQRNRFLDGAKEKKIPKKTAEKIFDLMAKFAGYGFNKSHSAAYAMIAFQTAFLKAHYPVEFMASLLSNNMGDAEKIMRYITECRTMEIEVAPPDMNESQKDFSVSKETIRFGLAAIKNVGAAAIEQMLIAREEGPFKTVVDFLERIDSRRVNKKVVESLIKCGALDSLEKNRAYLLSTIESSIELAQSRSRDRAMGQTSIFDVLPEGAEAATTQMQMPGSADIAELTEHELLTFEKETLGFYITSHPLESCKRDLKIYSTASTEGLGEVRSGSEASVGGIVSQLRETVTKKGARMAFIQLEDLLGSVEVVVFSDLYKKCREILESDMPLLVTGKVERDSGGGRGEPGDTEQSKMIASEIILLDEAKRLRPKKTHIYAQAEELSKENLEQLKGLLVGSAGNSEVFLRIFYPDDRVVVIDLPDELNIDPSSELCDKIKELMPATTMRFL